MNVDSDETQEIETVFQNTTSDANDTSAQLFQLMRTSLQIFFYHPQKKHF